MTPSIWEHAERLVDIAAVVAPALWWARKWLRRIEMAAGFSKDVALKHLPHIYWRLRRSDDAINLEVIEHPDIVWINGNGNGLHAPEVKRA